MLKYTVRTLRVVMQSQMGRLTETRGGFHFQMLMLEVLHTTCGGVGHQRGGAVRYAGCSSTAADTDGYRPIAKCSS